MTTIPIYGGPLKNDIVEMAYEECGQAGFDYQLTPEELDSGVRRLNAMLSEWLAAYGIDLGYNFPAHGHGNANEESGIPPGALQVVSTYLAMRIAPTIGKTMPAESKAALAMSFANLRSAYACVPTVQLRRQTIIGAGNRRYGWRGSPFFPVCNEDRE